MLLRRRCRGRSIPTVVSRSNACSPTRRLPRRSESVLDFESTQIPLPVSGAFCGVSKASSSISTASLVGPAAVGDELTEMLQVPLTGIDAWVQLSEFIVKSFGGAPTSRTPVTCKGTLPVLRTVSVCGAPVVPTGWSANVRLAGVRVTAGPTPVPLSGAVCGLPCALSVIRSEALLAPGWFGEKLIGTVQLPFGASDAPVHVSRPIQ